MPWAGRGPDAARGASAGIAAGTRGRGRLRDMATSPKQPGFLTKMVSLIRASSKDAPPNEGDSVQSRQTLDRDLEKNALKAHIELRRRDDRVRRREFNYLRKVRAEGLVAFPGAPQRPSVFQNSSSFNPDAGERRRTVRKIDDIEAQMSNQWAANKTASPPVLAQARPADGTRAKPLQPSATTAPVESGNTEPASEMDLDFTGLLAEADDATLPSPMAPRSGDGQDAVAGLSAREMAAQAEDAWPSGFSPSRVMAVDMGEHAANPALRDAAIRFAEGDDVGAEVALMAVLESPDAGDDTAEACSAALLDLYRATGQQADFDVVAIEYAQLFGRSAPEWFSVEEVTATVAGTFADAPSLAISSSMATWNCPTRLEPQDVATLQSLGDETGSTPLHWDALQTLATQTVEPLRALFQAWAERSVGLHFSGEDALLHALEAATPSNDHDVDPEWWGLRLAVLRTLNRPAEFEDVAVDFCMTYEVSPPSWSAPRCVLTHGVPSTAAADAASSGPAGVLQAEISKGEIALELSGALLGDVSDVLVRLLDRAPMDEPVTLSCTRLVRVDFAAAGSILSWVCGVEAQRRSVLFVNVPRLIAAYFDVIGISTHARVLSGKR